MITQLSVFIENKFGRLATVTDILRKNDIDIKALSLSDTADFGILRLIVDKPELAKEKLKETGVMAKTGNVVAAAMSDKPGGLSYLLQILTEENISIEYMYAFMGTDGDTAYTVMQTNNNVSACEVFDRNNIRMIENNL